MLDHVWGHLLPGLGDAEPDEDAQPDLDKRGCAGSGCRPHRPGRAPVRWEDWIDRAVRGGPRRQTGAAGEGADLGRHVAERGSRLEVTISERDNTLTFAVGTGEWLVSEPRDAHGDAVPVAASGGWLDDRTLQVETIFLESPHRLDIVCSLPTRSAEATWRGTPLDGGRLQTLHCPR